MLQRYRDWPANALSDANNNLGQPGRRIMRIDWLEIVEHTAASFLQVYLPDDVLPYSGEVSIR
jgi:hypothetical protein